MRNTGMLLAIVAFCVLAMTAIRVGAQSVKPTSETYSWSGELVEIDTAGPSVTVKAPVSGEQARSELMRIKRGERIVVTWSGFDTYADGIARVASYDATSKWNEPFAVPVEFVSYEPARRYVAIKFRVPQNSVDTLSIVKPGHWVTMISRHRAANETEAIVSVNPYGHLYSSSRT